jgi:predicted murein hydrolase (TIGR00659 family)
MRELGQIWVYLSASPLLHLTLTLVVYQLASMLYRRAGMTPLLNPVMLSIIAIVAILAWTGTSYEVYFDGAQFVHFLLGPATVALAIPLYRQFDKVRRSAAALLVSITAGSAAATGTAVGIGWLLGGTREALASLAPKSVTTPVAMGIAAQLGGIPALAAVFAVLTGLVGAVSGKYLFDALRLRAPEVRGFALGTASHGIGAARALQVHPAAGAYAALALGMQVVLAALLMPLVLWLF